jgi:hypothetical protein
MCGVAKSTTSIALATDPRRRQDICLAGVLTDSLDSGLGSVVQHQNCLDLIKGVRHTNERVAFQTLNQLAYKRSLRSCQKDGVHCLGIGMCRVATNGLRYFGNMIAPKISPRYHSAGILRSVP